MKNLWTLIFLSILCVFSCQNNPQNSASSPTSVVEKPLGGTAKMVQRLQQANANIDPIRINYFANQLREEKLKNDIKNASNTSAKMTAIANAAYEEIKVGNSEAAIRQLSELRMEMKNAGVDAKTMNQVNRILALAYLRLGEEQNCLGQPNDESCLLPIAGKGVYAVQEAAKSAIQIFEGILATEPDDLETIWLLNFAYMTLGEYPQGVPQKFLVPIKSFKSDIEIPKFKNIGKKLGVGTVALSGGVAFDDFNNDGLIDVVASSWGLDDQLRFFYNNGKGFTDVTEETGLIGITGGLNINHLDYNNDGFLDIFVLRGAWFSDEGVFPNSLLKNNGDGTFSDVTEEAGLLSFAPTQTATWADFNLDGHLDVFIGNESMSGRKKFPCEFYINNGNGTFSSQAEATRLNQLAAFVKGATAGDVNNDGWPDLYISLMGQPNILLKNRGLTQNGIVVFENITQTAKVMEPMASFPTWMWDFNNDGWLDIMAASFGTTNGNTDSPGRLMVANAQGQYAGGNPRFYQNNQNETFVEESEKLGMRDAIFAMGSNFGDIDNDGYLDAYFGTGNPKFSAIVPNKMYRNNTAKKMQDVTTAGGFGHSQKGHGVGFADVDNDGDQDVFCVLGGAFENDVFGDALFLNPYGNENNWVTLKLVGTTSNRAAIGAKVRVMVKDKSGESQNFYYWVSTGSSFGGNSLQLEMGIGKADKIEEIEIIWPNHAQTKTMIKDVAINQFYTIQEGATSLTKEDRKVLEF